MTINLAIIEQEKAQIANSLWFQLLPCEDLLCFFVLHDVSIQAFVVLAGWFKKTRHLKILPGVLVNIFQMFSEIYIQSPKKTMTGVRKLHESINSLFVA